MRGKERLAYIDEWIMKAGKVTVAEISKVCAVSEETVRRDLDKLESSGRITRVHGGAVWHEHVAVGDGRYLQRQGRNIPAKRKIASHIELVTAGKRSIMADSSSTVEEALKKLTDRYDLTVVTNSAHIFQVMPETDFTVISTGGIYNKHSLSYQGEIAKHNIQMFNVDIALVSCNALHKDLGVLDSYENEVEIKKAMMGQASETALLIDHTKFDSSVFLRFADLDEIDYIITDTKPSDEWIEICKQRKITLIY